jgi:hypothetical protein
MGSLPVTRTSDKKERFPSTNLLRRSVAKVGSSATRRRRCSARTGNRRSALHCGRCWRCVNSRPNGNLRNELRKARDISATKRMQLDDDHGVRAPRAPQHGLPAREARHGDRSSREHENSKSLPAGSNPSKRHLADRGIILPSDQERKTRPIAAIQIKPIPGRWVHSERSRKSGGARPRRRFSSIATQLRS